MKKIVGVLICMVLIITSCLPGGQSLIKEKNNIINFFIEDNNEKSNSNDMVNNLQASDPQLTYIIMCDWATGYGSHGPPKTSFDLGETVYLYCEWANVEIGDYFNSKWYKDGSLEHTTSGTTVDWAGTGATWHYITPTDSGNWRADAYCNNVFKGSGPAFTIINSPPETPKTPTGPTFGYVDISYDYFTVTTDVDNDLIAYRFDFVNRITGWTEFTESDVEKSMSNIWEVPGIYIARSQAKDEHNTLSGWSPPLMVTIVESNNPPHKPSTPSGPSSGEIGVSYSYSSSAIDPEDDNVYLLFDWDDGTDSGWKGPYSSGAVVSLSHIWSEAGSYNVKVKAMDTMEKVSSWSEALRVVIQQPQPPTIIHISLYNIKWGRDVIVKSGNRYLVNWEDEYRMTFTYQIPAEYGTVELIGIDEHGDEFLNENFPISGYYEYTITWDTSFYCTYHDISNSRRDLDFSTRITDCYGQQSDWGQLLIRAHCKYEPADECCFPAGTKITMADKTYKNIEDIKVGDEILSYDVEKNRFSSWKVQIIARPVHPICEINNGLLRFTAEHPIFIKKKDGSTCWAAVEPFQQIAKGLKEDIYQLEVGDYVFNSNQQWIQIDSVTYYDTPVVTYNILSFTGRNTYFANDILVFEEFPKGFYILGYILNQEHPILYLLNLIFTILQGKPVDFP